MHNSKSPDNELQEAITKHIEQVSAAKEDKALKDSPFQVLFATDAQNNVKVTVRWPYDAPYAQSVHIIASMLHHISAGHWKPPMIASVNKEGINCGQLEVAQEILHEWGRVTQIQTSDVVCVPPRQVFMHNNSEQGIV